MTRSRAGSIALLATVAACGLELRGTAPADGGAPSVDAGDAAIADAQADASDASSADGAAPVEWKKSITIAASQVAGALADFPVWIDLVDADVAARASADGHDVHFTASDGTSLDYEIQRWDGASKHLSAWVRVPQLSSTSATVIELRYGGARAAPGPDPARVFSASFAAVWHLEDSLLQSSIVEATGARPGTAYALSTTQQVAAKLGGGVAFDGGAAQISFGNPLAGTTPHTISLWVSQRTTTTNDALVVVGNGACGQSRWLHAHFNGDTVASGFYCNDWGTPNVPIDNVGWVLLHWVYEGGPQGTSRLYRNGALAAGPFMHGGSAINTQGMGGYIGNAPIAFGTNMGATATIDEVRIATVARGAAWIATEWANQSAPGSFYQVGPETAVR